MHVCLRSKSKCSFSGSLVIFTRSLKSNKYFLPIRKWQLQCQSSLGCLEKKWQKHHIYQYGGRIATGLPMPLDEHLVPRFRFFLCGKQFVSIRRDTFPTHMHLFFFHFMSCLDCTLQLCFSKLFWKQQLMAEAAYPLLSEMNRAPTDH